MDHEGSHRPGGGFPKINCMAKSNITKKQMMGYSIGSLGTGVYATTPSILLLIFMTNTLGIEAWMAGLAISLPKFWDMITDPIMGVISDRTRTKWGKRRPYMLVGAILMSISFVFLFSVPDLETPEMRLLYIFTVFTISATSYTIFAVPYMAMPAEMSNDPHERTVIMTYRFIFVFFGLIVGSSLAPILVDYFGGGREAYSKMSFIVGGFCAIMMLISFFSTKSLPIPPFKKPTKSIWGEFKAGFTSKPLLVLMLTYLFQVVGIMTFFSLFLYYGIYILGAGASDAGITLFFLLTSGMISIPFWTMATKKFGKRKTYKVSILLYVVINLFFLLPGEGFPILAYYAMIIGLGIPFGCILMLPFAMVTDIIQFEKQKTGNDNDGVFTGVWTATEKTGFAIGPLVAGVALSAVGFVESDGGQVTQSAETILSTLR